MLLIILGAGVMYGISSRFVKRTSALRWSLGILLGGLLAYNLLAFGVFNLTSWLTQSGITGIIYWTLSGQLLGFVGGWFWSHTGK